MQQFGFVPHRLETGEIDLSHFPLNVLFVAHKWDGETLISGTASRLTNTIRCRLRSTKPLGEKDSEHLCQCARVSLSDHSRCPIRAQFLGTVFLIKNAGARAHYRDFRATLSIVDHT